MARSKELKSAKKDIELSMRLWKAGIRGAIDLRSEQRSGEKQDKTVWEILHLSELFYIG